jgi:hypothetical protein
MRKFSECADPICRPIQQNVAMLCNRSGLPPHCPSPDTFSLQLKRDLVYIDFARSSDELVNLGLMKTGRKLNPPT